MQLAHTSVEFTAGSKLSFWRVWSSILWWPLLTRKLTVFCLQYFKPRLARSVVMGERTMIVALRDVDGRNVRLRMGAQIPYRNQQEL